MIDVLDFSVAEVAPAAQAEALRSIAYFYRDAGKWELKFCFLISAGRVERRDEPRD